jgi:hypothetical protein
MSGVKHSDPVSENILKVGELEAKERLDIKVRPRIGRDRQVMLF